MYIFQTMRLEPKHELGALDFYSYYSRHYYWKSRINTLKRGTALTASAAISKSLNK